MPDVNAVASAGYLKAGQAALGRMEWAEAQIAFIAALASEETPEAYDGLAEACSWLHDEHGALEARERAFYLHRQRGQRAAAAMPAIERMSGSRASSSPAR